ncbi:MAG: type III pantothenate kinase [Methylotenera sp.]|nr:type III pantothenate kinase [Oligoflexia bacterium]
MILALDVGNSQIFGGVFETGSGKIRLRFRKTSRSGASSDEMGLFLRSVLRENQIDPTLIRQIALCSVVPDVMHSMKNCCTKYFGITPFILQAGARTGLRIKYRNPLEVGADRIANSIGAVQRHPGRNLIIVDMGTATTFCAVNGEKDYLGGTIIPGLRISMEALESQTAKLPSVEIIAKSECLGKSTVESIQSGLFFSHLGAMREIIARVSREAFGDVAERIEDRPLVLGTGGFASLYAKSSVSGTTSAVFDEEIPDLVLLGLRAALDLNPVSLNPL